MSSALLKFVPFVESTTNFADDAAEVWTYLITETRDEFVSQVSFILDKYVDRLSTLAAVQDTAGRRAIDMATPKYKQAMLERSFLFRRYEIRDGPAEHVSATCVVRLAKDHSDGRRNVALKFIRNRDHFQREVSVREACHLDDSFVVSSLRLHDGDLDKDFGHEAEKKGYYRYCLVMPAAERNLGAVLAHEHIAGRDWDQLRLISKQLIAAVGHMHTKGYIHGDVKRT